MIYQVTGEAKRWLDGHTKEFVTRVQAGTPEQAADIALSRRLYNWGWPDGEWAEEPTVELIPEDQAMRLIGAPMLPGMEG